MLLYKRFNSNKDIITEKYTALLLGLSPCDWIYKNSKQMLVGIAVQV